jgi:DNA polymerase III alpha subunit
MKVDSFNTKLADRVLWYDGITSISADDILTTSVPFQYVDRETPSIKTYNKYVSANEALRVKTSCDPLNYTWNIPASYKALNVETFLFDRLVTATQGSPEIEFDKRAVRVAQELQLYKKLRLYDVLRTLIYVINMLSAHGVVWGVGRGSSVSSYVLYLIGTHDIDSVAYDLDITEFLHT